MTSPTGPSSDAENSGPRTDQKQSQILEGPGSTSSALWLHSPSANPPLRIGILLDGPRMARFCESIIRQIQACEFANIELLVYRKPKASSASNPAERNLLQRLTHRFGRANLRKQLLYDLYLKSDDRKKNSNHPRQIVDCSPLLAGIDSIVVEPVGQRFVHRFPPEDIEKIRSYKLDVLLRFGFNILKGDILSSARYGVWSYHHGDNDFYRGGPPMLWELVERNPMSGVILQVLTEELDAGVVLCKSLFTTQPTISTAQNAFGPYWGASDFVIRKLHELHRFGWEHVGQRSIPAAPYRGKRKLYRTPGNLDMVRWLGPVLAKKAIQQPFRKPTVQHWKIGIRVNAEPLLTRNSNGSLDGFRWIDSPKGHFWADPFLHDENGKKWMFFEDYIYAEKRGIIACAEIAADGTPREPLPCLDEAQHHFSYPYVFRAGEDLFMLPEARSTNEVRLYRCEKFPGKWRRQATLLRGKFVDPSVWWRDGLWWMTVTAADPDARSSSLYLFYSEKLDGRWQLHTASPISTDTRRNRGAGRIVEFEGRWIRPSQSSCPIYGYSFALNEITKLTTSDYEESFLREFKPEALKMQAMHTYNWIPGLEVIDGARDVPRSKV